MAGSLKAQLESAEARVKELEARLAESPDLAKVAALEGQVTKLEAHLATVQEAHERDRANLTAERDAARDQVTQLSATTSAPVEIPIRHTIRDVGLGGGRIVNVGLR